MGAMPPPIQSSKSWRSVGSLARCTGARRHRPGAPAASRRSTRRASWPRSKLKPVPLHAYYMQRRAEESFAQMSGATGGGTHQKLDVNSRDGAQLLTDAVCKQILSSLGGKALEDAYER